MAAAHVQLWDRGTWKPTSANPKRDLAKGHLAFVLKGKRMKGGWALIRLPDAARARKRNWLLIKELDDEARRGKARRRTRQGNDIGEIGPHAQRNRGPSEGASWRQVKVAGSQKVLGISIGHPDKVLWPKSKFGAAVTKLDLARYYAAAAERMLPHVVQRPISIVRAPDGITGATFFQRHAMAGALAIPVRGQNKPFLGIVGARGLVALAQAAAVEIQPWGCAKADPERPARIVFDLDPAPSVPFDRVVEAANELRVRLTGPWPCAVREDDRRQGTACRHCGRRHDELGRCENLREGTRVSHGAR